MTDFVSTLELSVRTSNVLRSNDIETAEQFMSLTREQVMGFKGLGRRSWSEIRDIQESIRNFNRRQSLPGRAAVLLAELNDLELESHGFFLVRDKHRRLRLGRFVKGSDFDD